MKQLAIIALAFWLLFLGGCEKVKELTSIPIGPAITTIQTGAQTALNPTAHIALPTAAVHPPAAVLPIAPRQPIIPAAVSSPEPQSQAQPIAAPQPAPTATPQPGGLDIHVGTDSVSASLRNNPPVATAAPAIVIEDPGREMLPTLGAEPTMLQQGQYTANDGAGYSPECIALKDKYKDKTDNTPIPTADFIALAHCLATGKL